MLDVVAVVLLFVLFLWKNWNNQTLEQKCQNGSKPSYPGTGFQRVQDLRLKVPKRVPSESITESTVESTYAIEEADIQALLNDALNRDEIDKNGIIVGARLRKLLGLKIKAKEIQLLNNSSLGKILASHGYLLHSRKPATGGCKTFRINVKKLQPKVRVVKKEPMVLTYEGAEEIPKAENAKPGLGFCLLCKKFIDGEMNEHVRKDHKRGKVHQIKEEKTEDPEFVKNENTETEEYCLQCMTFICGEMMSDHIRENHQENQEGETKESPQKENEEPKTEFCLICKEYIYTGMSEHMKKNHKKESVAHFNPCKAHFSTTHKIDQYYMCVEMSVKNITSLNFQIKSLQLVHQKRDYIWMCDQFISLGAEEVYQFKLERQLFKNRDKKYILAVYAEAPYLAYIHRFSLEVHETLYDLINAKRMLKQAQAELESKEMYRKLPDHLPDEGLLKLFTSDFTIKNVIDDLTFEEFSRYMTIVDFKKEGTKLTEANYVTVMQLLVEISDLYINHMLFGFEILKIRVDCTPEKPHFINISKVTNFPECIEEGDYLVLNEIDGATGKPKKQEKENIHSITKIDEERVYFAESHLVNSVCKYNVCFKKDRTCFQMQQEALLNADSYTINRILFPFTYGSNSHSGYTFTWYNPSIESNVEQKQAITSIMSGSAFPAPHVIFGPPGTGKTATIVESICQIWKHKPEANILVTAPSNAACDEIATRLLKYIPAYDLYRYYSRTMLTQEKELDVELKLISNLSKGFDYPSIPLLKKYRIVLCTLIQTGKLVLNGLQPNHFEYIFFDECGSAIEPDALIPISGLISFQAPGQTNLIISGDPKQLGPVVTCNFASVLGLGESLLARLMASFFYQPMEGQFNENIITKLVQNFRCHPAILKVPNELFYDGQLIAKAPAAITDFALNWKLLPNKQIPMIFHGVDGETKTKAKSTSMYNDCEINEIFNYLQEIICNGINGLKIPLSEIGIVSPYSLQCECIKSRLKKRGWTDVQVGSAEQYQGKEKMVIILATVRSNTKTAGFLGNPRRLNVVITRAKGLLIIIGNPNTLMLDMNWFKLLEYCKQNKATKGVKFELKKPKTEDIIGNTVNNYFETKALASVDKLVKIFDKLWIDKFSKIEE